MALGIDVEMALSKTKFQACWQNLLLMSQILFCFGLFSSPKFIFILLNKVMLWGGGRELTSILFWCFFFAPLQSIPLFAAAKKANRFLFLHPQMPPDNSFIALRNHYISDELQLLASWWPLCVVVSTTALYLYLCSLMYWGHVRATQPDELGWVKETI